MFFKEMLVAERDRILKEMGLTFASFDGKVKDYRLSGKTIVSKLNNQITLLLQVHTDT